MPTAARTHNDEPLRVSSTPPPLSCRRTAGDRPLADGLPDDQLRQVMIASGTSILGLVQHLAEAERYWFGYHLTGAAWDPVSEHGMAIPADRAADDVLRVYRAAIEDSDRAIRAAGEPDAPVAVPVEGNKHTLRWVMAHMTSETARHAGHADILREQLDGTTGR
jgi:uncharacterized damage-inducible protein DinB